MPEISITLPSLRQEAVLQRIKEFSITNGDSDYEIVVVSPFTMQEDRVVHIYEERPLGNVYAHHIAYKHSSGKYIVWWADDSSPTADCLSNMLRFMKSKKDPFIGCFRIYGQGQERSQCRAYNRLYACWGCASKNTVSIIGGYFDPIFRGHWADPDMGLRTWAKGGRVEICPNAWVIKRYIEDEVSQKSWSEYFIKDTETFFNRWHDMLGKGIARDFHSVNRPIPVNEQFVYLYPSFTRPVLLGLNKIYRALQKIFTALTFRLLRWAGSVPVLREIKGSVGKRFFRTK